MKTIKKMVPYLVAVLLVLMIFMGSLAIEGIWPFGEFTIGKSDAIVQFKPMLFNFIMKIKHGILGTYSFNNGLGNPVMFNYLYYLASPLNLIALLFNDANAMYLSVIILKLICMTLTITFYAKNKLQNNYLAIIVAISYVFSSWFITYHFCFNWLDIFLILPLYHYGLEKMLGEKNNLLFVFSLTYMIVANFYLAFPVCVYTILYYIFYVIYKKYGKEEIIRSFKSIVFNTIGAILLAMPFLYLLWICYTKMNLTTEALDSQYNVSIISFLRSFFYGNVSFMNGTSGEVFPNFSSNILVMVSIFLYFINENIPKREKTISFVVLVFCIYPIFIHYIDFIFNFFHNVRGFTFRYSFIYSFLIMLLFIRNLQTMDKKVLMRTKFIFLIFMVILFCCYKEMEYKVFILNLVYLLSYAVLLLLYDNNKVHKLLLVLLVMSNSLFVMSLGLKNELTIEDEGLYNREFNSEYVNYRVINNGNENEYLNNNMYSNSNALYYMSSMNYGEIRELMQGMGCSAGESSIICPSENKILNMLFNVKNEFYLEKIYAVNKDIMNEFIIGNNAKEFQESLIKAMTGVDNIFDKKKLEGTLKEGKYYYTTDEDGYFIDHLYHGNVARNSFQTYNEFYNNVSDIQEENKEVTIYTVNENKLNEAYDLLYEQQIEYTYYSDSRIEGKIKVSDKQMIFTSIPYDESWIVEIDGKKIKPVKVVESLMGFEVGEGEHEIKMQYKIDIKWPLIVSMATLVVIISSRIRRKKID